MLFPRESETLLKRLRSLFNFLLFADDVLYLEDIIDFLPQNFSDKE